MTDSALLVKEIEGLPADYRGEIRDFVSYLKHKASPVAKPTKPAVARETAANPYKAIEALEGFALKQGSHLTVDRFLEMRHEETEREEAAYRSAFRPAGEL
jgi:hypothetical protein